MGVHHAFGVLLEPLALQDLEGPFPLVVDAGGLVRLLDQILLLLLEQLLISDLFLLVQTLAVLVPHDLLELLVLELHLLVLYFHAHVFDFEFLDLGLLLRLHRVFLSLFLLLACLYLVCQLGVLLRNLDLALQSFLIFPQFLHSILDELLLHLLLLQKELFVEFA